MKEAFVGALALCLMGAFSYPTTVRAYALLGSVVGNGGTPSSGINNATYSILGTVGQPVVGVSANTTYTLCHGYWCWGGSRVVAVEQPPGTTDLPIELSFGPPTPNPASRDVRFALALPTTANVALAIYDVQGRVVQHASGTMEPGYHTLRWDGTDLNGSPRKSGVYFARLLVDGELVGKRRIVITR